MANGTSVSGSGCTSTTDASNTIQFSLTGTILLNSLLPGIANTSPGNLTITGPTTSPGITIDGASSFRVLAVDSGATLNVANLTVADANATGSGGGILNNSTLTVTNSTFSGNIAFGSPDDTIANGGTATFKGTIMATAHTGNCTGLIIDGGYNISNDAGCGFTKTGTANNGSNVDPDLNLAGLAENGGPTETIALQSSSPAIEAIPVASCTDQATPPNPLTTDQRGYVRPSPAHPAACDIGAYEDNGPPLCNARQCAEFRHGERRRRCDDRRQCLNR
jgi:hypothetical protein